MRKIRKVLHRNHRDDRGAVAVEAALVLPVVMLLVFGMIEFSLLMRDWVSITAATRAGARIASASPGAGPGTCITGTDGVTCAPATSPALAQAAADAMQRSLTGVPPTSINYILVYQANSKGYPCTTATNCDTATATTMPASCSGYANCVKYNWSAIKGQFRYNSGTWASATINACTNEQYSLGIYLNGTHKFVTGLFGATLTMADRAVMKFEPLPLDSCKSTSPHPHA